MRQIKFRAWDIDSSEMLTDFNSGHSEFYLDFDKGVMRLMMCVEDDYPEVREANIMQFTGLLDKNGKDIYEGDIVRSPVNVIDSIRFEHGAFVWGTDLLGWDYDEFKAEHVSPSGWAEVIGNIWETPELLKQV